MQIVLEQVNTWLAAGCLDRNFSAWTLHGEVLCFPSQLGGILVSGARGEVHDVHKMHKMRMLRCPGAGCDV